MAGQHADIDHTGLTGVGTGVATDAIFDAKGDLPAGTGANTAAKLTVGANDTILMADSGQSTGLKWVAAGTPTDQDYDDVAAVGTADTFARGDHLHGMPSAGAGGSVATDAIWDAGGDLVQGTGANTAARLAVGAAGTLLGSTGSAAAWQGAYASWTPTLTADGGNPTLGTGSTVVGRYAQFGKMVHAYATITFGSSGTAAGSGAYEFTFPVTAATPLQPIVGTANLFDNSTGTFQTGLAYQLDTGEFRVAYSGTALIVTEGTPWAWAAGDVIQLNLTYEAA